MYIESDIVFSTEYLIRGVAKRVYCACVNKSWNWFMPVALIGRSIEALLLSSIKHGRLRLRSFLQSEQDALDVSGLERRFHVPCLRLLR